MKRSENIAYLTYAASKAGRSYRKSLCAYLDFIDESHKELSPHERVDALQRVAELLFYLGDEGVAMFLYQVAFDCQPSSLRTKMGYARFLCRQLKNYDQADQLCDEIISESKNISQSDEDIIGAQRQAQFAYELKNEIKVATSSEGS